MGKTVRLIMWESDKIVDYDLGDTIEGGTSDVRFLYKRSDLEWVSKGLTDLFHGNLGEWRRWEPAEKDNDVIAWRSDLNVPKDAVEFAFEHAVYLYMKPEAAKQYFTKKSSAYSGCGWWHVKQNILVIGAIAEENTISGDDEQVNKFEEETCSTCGKGWNDNANMIWWPQSGLEQADGMWEVYQDIIRGKAKYDIETKRWHYPRSAEQMAKDETEEEKLKSEQAQVLPISAIFSACVGFDVFEGEELPEGTSPVPLGKAIRDGKLTLRDLNDIRDFKETGREDYMFWSRFDGLTDFETACDEVRGLSAFDDWTRELSIMLQEDSPISKKDLSMLKKTIEDADLDNVKLPIGSG